MTKDRNLKKTLQKILEKQVSDAHIFESELESDLQVFEPESLDLPDLNDREVLSKLFIKLGENQLKDGKAKFLDSFRAASLISPDNYSVFYLQGRAYLQHSNNLQVLSLAKKAFEKALELDPLSFDAAYELGCVLIQQGLNLEEAPFFQDAIHQFEKAETLIKSDEDVSSFYWQFGRTWFYLGKLSGEAMDFHYAIDKYKKVDIYEMKSPFYWNDYGDAIIEMGFLLGKKEYFFEAIELYETAISLDSDHFQGYFNLACAYQCVFEMSIDIKFFEKANENFEKSSKIEASTKSRYAALWLKWGQLLASFGKLKREISFLELSIEKFIQADSIEPNHPGILSRFGEAEMLLGANTDDINLLRQAEDKLVRSLEVNSDAPEVWYLYGICLNELGRYFQDENFYKQAIQKFQYGLSLTQSDPLLWYGLAMSHFALGDMLNDREMIEKASLYCSQVLEFGGQIFLQFWNDWAVMLMRLSEMTLDEHYIESALDKFEQIIRRHGENQDQNDYSKRLEDLSLENMDSDEIDKDEIDLEWLYNYGCALDMHGDFTDETTSYEQAVQILSNVVRLDPDYSHARYNLALALSHLGEAVSDIEPLQKASEHFEILISENPEDDTAWNDWGLSLLHLAELIHDSARPDVSRDIYAQAEKKFFHALSLGCLPGFYNLACLYAMTENYKAAIHYMERAEDSDSLPPIDDMMHDDWLDGLRKTDAFKSFISTITNKQEKK